MPEHHSVGGNWHGGKKDTCVKCGYKPPPPVVVEEPKLEPEPIVVKQKRTRKKRVQ